MSHELFLQYIIEKNDEQLKQSLSNLKNNGINLHWKDPEGFNNYLHIAVSVDNLFAVEELLQVAPDLAKEKNECGNSPLHLAAMFDYDACATSLIKSDRTLILNKDYRSPLDFAERYGSNKVLKILRAVEFTKPEDTTYIPHNIVIGFNPKTNYATEAAVPATEQDESNSDDILMLESLISELGRETPPNSTLNEACREFDFDDIFPSLPEVSPEENSSLVDGPMYMRRPKFLPSRSHNRNIPLSVDPDEEDDEDFCLPLIKQPHNRFGF